MKLHNAVGASPLRPVRQDWAPEQTNHERRGCDPMAASFGMASSFVVRRLDAAFSLCGKVRNHFQCAARFPKL